MQVTGSDTFHVVVCGAGIAGLTLALQIRQNFPRLPVLVIDRQERPLPRAAFKVGESTTELGAQYFTETLGLGRYMDERHLRKLGLRFFYQPRERDGTFCRRPEVGISRLLPPYGYQIDRGLIENDLRETLEEKGVNLLEGESVKDIVIGSNGEGHCVYLMDTEGNRGTVRCRWVVDAMGRHSLLRRKLRLTRRKPGGDAAWARVHERVDVSDLVDEVDVRWHQRVPDRLRYYSTNHLVGEGYWVWLIALPGNYTSIGVVTHPDYHDYKDYSTEPKFRQWLLSHEPALARRLSTLKFADFRKMPRYSFSSSRVFSEQRWICTGEASAFPDPLYSPNFELIALNNGIACELIARDLQRGIGETEVARFNQFFLTYVENVSSVIRATYPCLGNHVVAALKLMWDSMVNWSFLGPLYHHGLFLDNERRNRSRRETGRFLFLARRVQRLFQDWARYSRGNVRFDYMDLLELPFYTEARMRGLATNPTVDVEQSQRESMALFEELAQVLFLIAVADSHPPHLGSLPNPLWVNAWAISLDAKRWKDEGLFMPRTKPRSLLPILSSLRRTMTLPGIDKWCDSDVILQHS